MSINVYELLSRDNFITVNKTVAKKIGLQASVLISELCYRRQYLDRAGKLTEDGFFYATIEDVEEETTLSVYEQRKALDLLKSLGIVEVERRDLPAKRYIYIDEDALTTLIYAETCCADSNNQVCEKFTNKSVKNSQTNNINNNITNNYSHTSSKDDVLERVSPATPENSTPHYSEKTSKKTSEPAKPEKVSGKLFDTPKKTKKSSVQKTNAFITMCERVSGKHKFSEELKRELGNYFRMLGASGSLLPEQSIEEQMKILAGVRERDRVSVVKDTVAHGWKSLQYAAKDCKEGSTPSWDTARPDAFKAKTMEEKRKNPLEGVPEEDIF